MKLRLGQPVHSTDGPFGILAEIVVNPNEKKVTHIIVEPTLGYYQSRLVPIWLVDSIDGAVKVALDESHLRQLQRVGYSDFIHHDETVEVDDRWDIGSVDTVAFARWNGTESLPALDDLVGEYQRVPVGECEIQLTSKVKSVDGSTVGTVHGFVADEDDHLSAVVVRVGVPGMRHDVLVPFTDISRVLHHRVELSLTERDFFELPHTGTLNNAASEDEPKSSRLRRRFQTTAARVAVRGERVVEKTTNRLVAAVKDGS